MIRAFDNLLKRIRRALNKHTRIAPRHASGCSLYAQGLEDLYLRRIFDAERGFYVDVGANDGCFVSNTYSLYLAQWRGICIEPNPIAYGRLCRQRPEDICLNLGVGRQDGQLALRWVEGVPEGSSFAPSDRATRTCMVPVRPLNRILREHSVRSDFELLTVDVEGMEMDVLSSMDWTAYHPHIVIVEYNNQGNVVLDTLDFLRPFGYKPILINRWNIMYSRLAEADVLKTHRYQDWYTLDRIRL